MKKINLSRKIVKTFGAARSSKKNYKNNLER